MRGAGTDFQYVLETLRGDPPERLASLRITPDFAPALEWAALAAARRGAAGPVHFGGQAGHIEPCWDETSGPPFVAGFRALVEDPSGLPREFAIPLDYFQPLAEQAAAMLIKRGQLAANETFRYVVCAYPGGAHDQAAEPAPRFSVKAVDHVLEPAEASLADFLARAVAHDAPPDDQLPVFVPEAVLTEAADAMHSAGAAETGGILLGHLHRDALAGLFLEVSAQIPVQHAEESLMRLTFTAETWAAVDAAAALRGRGEIYVGWWHSHPSAHWCEQCPPATRARCRAVGRRRGDFLSLHDVALHRAVFPRAYSVALVFSDGCQSGGEVIWSLFGWHRGLLCARGFHVLSESQRQAGRGASTHLGDQSDVASPRSNA